MAMEDGEYDQLETYVKENFRRWISDTRLAQADAQPPAKYEIELRERVARLEGERDWVEGIRDTTERIAKLEQRLADAKEFLQRTLEEHRSFVDSGHGRVHELSRRIDRYMLWVMGLVFSILGGLLAAYRFGLIGGGQGG